MTLRSKIREALAAGPKFYSDLHKLSKVKPKQLSNCLYQLTSAGKIQMRVVDAKNQYTLSAGKEPMPRAKRGPYRKRATNGLAAKRAAEHPPAITAVHRLIARDAGGNPIIFDPAETAAIRALFQEFPA